MNSPWSADSSQVLTHHGTDPETGLLDDEFQKRLGLHGPNSIVVKKNISHWVLLFKQFKNPVVYVLLISSFIAFVLHGTMDGWAILGIVILNAIIGYSQEAKAETSLEALASLTSPKCRVFRNGKTTIVDSALICPGDILILEAGDYVAADARIVVASQLAADESILTGESLPTKKQTNPIMEKAPLAERSNMLYASTAISRGTAKAVVVFTGKDTEIGKISEMMKSTETSITPMQVRLEIVSKRLLFLGLIIILVVIPLELAKGNDLVTVIMAALSLSIAAIPEGLSTVVTLALVLAVHRMSKKKVLVRKMESVETLGATDIICTDKTGTLTTGKMKVRECYETPGADGSHLHAILILCNNASLSAGGNGDTTEIALLEYSKEQGMDLEQILKSNPRLREWSFDSERKIMSVAVQSDKQFMIYAKGAPESILSQCILTQEEHQKINEKVDHYSQKGMRLLALAYKETTSAQIHTLTQDEAESALRFVGIVALADPPRPESLPAVKNCQAAGIRIIMMTGDHPRTAAAVALELGIIDSSGNQVMTGAEMDALNDNDLKKVIDTVAVYARVSPANKLRLVQVLKGLGHVVAMTGDGVNDAPALKAASIGVAMGRAGTEVARQASSIVLTDDNFSSIVDAVEEGRALNGNIKRTLQYLLSTNLGELLFILGASIAGWPVPLLPVNILWVNLVTDGVPALALASESVPHNYLKDSSGPSTNTFFDRAFYREMIFVALVTTSMCLMLYYYSFTRFDALTSRSMAFSFMVYIVLLRSFSSRSETRAFFELKINFYHLFSVLLPLVFQIGMQQFDFFLKVFKIKSLSLNQNLVLVLLAALPLTIFELMKLWRRK